MNGAGPKDWRPYGGPIHDQLERDACGLHPLSPVTRVPPWNLFLQVLLVSITTGPGSFDK